VFATHLKFGTILRVSSDPSLEPENIDSVLPKDFVHVKPRFESAGIEDAHLVHGSELDSAQASTRLDYVEHPDVVDEPEPLAVNNALAPETDAQHQNAVLTVTPRLKPETTITDSALASAARHSSVKTKKTPQARWQRFVKELLLETLLPAWLIVTFLIIPVGVRGESMYPTLESGDFLLVAKFERWLAVWGFRPNYLHRGDVIVLKPPSDNEYSFEPVSRLFEALPLLGAISNRLPEDWKFRPYFVKRIVAMSGDMVEVRNGVVYINAQKTREFYINTPAAIEDSSPTFVKPGTVFVMGDNRLRGSSLDSRVFGLVHIKDVAGRAVLRLGHTSSACKGFFGCLATWLRGWHVGTP
jgi:signal peptidase I